MSVDVKIPEIGESITEGLLVEWSQEDGARVGVDDPLLVLETDKITMTVNAEGSGRLERLVPEGETVEVDQVLGGCMRRLKRRVRRPRKSRPLRTRKKRRRPKTR